MALVDLVGIISISLSIFLCLSPIPAIYDGLKKMNLKSFTISYFIMGCVQSIMWGTFGWKIDDFYVYFINAYGMILFFIYLNIYIYVSGEKTKFLIANGFVFLIFMGALFLLSIQFNLYSAVITSSIWEATTILTMRLAIMNKDSFFVNILFVCFIYKFFNVDNRGHFGG